MRENSSSPSRWQRIIGGWIPLVLFVVGSVPLFLHGIGVLDADNNRKDGILVGFWMVFFGAAIQVYWWKRGIPTWTGKRGPVLVDLGTTMVVVGLFALVWAIFIW